LLLLCLFPALFRRRRTPAELPNFNSERRTAWLLAVLLHSCTAI
jgi:hypothetical protein